MPFSNSYSTAVINKAADNGGFINSVQFDQNLDNLKNTAEEAHSNTQWLHDNSIITEISNQFAALTQKLSLTNNDKFLIEDSEDNHNKKYIDYHTLLIQITGALGSGGSGGTTTYIKTTAPSTTDDSDAGYNIGDFWYDSNDKFLYLCVDNTAGNANWVNLTVLVINDNIIDTDHTWSSSKITNYTNAKYIKTAAPSTTDDSDAGYNIGDIWVNTTDDNVYICVDNTTGNANWVNVSTTDLSGYILPTPVIDIASSVYESSSTTGTITNYDPDSTYTIWADIGTISYSGGDTFTYSTPSVNADTNDTIYCYCVKTGYLISDTATKTVTIVDVPTEPDSSVVFTDSDTDISDNVEITV